MRCLPQRLIVSGTRGFLLCSVLVVSASCVERELNSYATYAEAADDQAIKRGWIPLFTPHSARNLQEVHDLDTNERLLLFTAPREDLLTMAAKLEAVSSLRQPSGLLRPPPGWNLDATPVEQSVSSSYSSVTPTGSDCVRIDWARLKVYVWTCE